MGCFGVPRWHETAGNRKKQGEKDKESEKEKPKTQQNRHDFVAVFVGHFDCKTGDLLGIFLKILAIFVPTNRGYSQKFGTRLRSLVNGPLQAPSLSTPWLGMILILPLGILAQIHRNCYFLHWWPPNPPQSSETLALVRLARVSTSPSCLQSTSPEGPQSMVNFLGDFLGEIFVLPGKWFGTPQKTVQRIRWTDLYKNPCTKFAQKSAQRPWTGKSCFSNRALVEAIF